VKTWITLRKFIAKYGASTAPWRSHTAFEVDTFQNYDALDLRAYLALKTGKRGEESTRTGNNMDCSLETTTSKSTGTVDTISGASNDAVNISTSAFSEAKRKQSTTYNEYGHGDQNSITSKSSKIKSKFKIVLAFGIKKNNNATIANRKDINGRAIHT
jgi:hypothetical protein